jgi:hypothetical protein
VPFAVVANAYIATGVTAAAMLFYRDRSRALVAQSTAPAARPGVNTERS